MLPCIKSCLVERVRGESYSYYYASTVDYSYLPCIKSSLLLVERVKGESYSAYSASTVDYSSSCVHHSDGIADSIMPLIR